MADDECRPVDRHWQVVLGAAVQEEPIGSPFGGRVTLLAHAGALGGRDRRHVVHGLDAAHERQLEDLERRADVGLVEIVVRHEVVDDGARVHHEIERVREAHKVERRHAEQALREVADDLDDARAVSLREAAGTAHEAVHRGAGILLEQLFEQHAAQKARGAREEDVAHLRRLLCDERHRAL